MICRHSFGLRQFSVYAQNFGSAFKKPKKSWAKRSKFDQGSFFKNDNERRYPDRSGFFGVRQNFKDTHARNVPRKQDNILFSKTSNKLFDNLPVTSSDKSFDKFPGRGFKKFDHEAGQIKSSKLRVVDMSALSESLVYSILVERTSSIGNKSFSPVHERTIEFLHTLQSQALKIKTPIVTLMEKACPGWNEEEGSTSLPTILEEYKSQVLKQTTFAAEHHSIEFADISAYKSYCAKTKQLPALDTLVQTHSRLVDNGKGSELLFNDITIEYLIRGFFSFYSQMIALSDPLVIQSRWKHVDLSHPEKLFPMARRIHRKIYLHIGPTNSGKTYTALQAFQNAKSGFYAGPLRLLAREVYSRMKAANKACNLVTGEEVIEELDEHGNPALLNSGTIEMTDITKDMEVAVIDEIQMIEDKERGWAWTQAVLGVRAKELHLCGDPNTENIIRRLAELTGDTLEIKRYQRLSPLEVASKNMGSPLKSIEPGDCFVFFSKKELVKAREEIQETTKEKCAIIYGSLPAETRAQQALEFNDPNSEYKYLVASDAVGMGLNLAIRRIVFSRTDKFNGNKIIKVPIAQIKQIAGRAGRYHVPGQDAKEAGPTTGVATAIAERDLKYVQSCMKLASPEVFKAGLFPPEDFLKDYANSVGLRISFDSMLHMLVQGTKIGNDFFLTNLRDMVATAEIFSDIEGLLLEEKIILSKAPVPSRDAQTQEAFRAFCQIIARGQAISISDISEAQVNILANAQVDGVTTYNDKLEALHRTISLYLWLSYRFPNNFIDREGATELKLLCEDRINMELSQKSSSFNSSKSVFHIAPFARPSNRKTKFTMRP